ncbi:MAG TPA: hypothetical protein VIM69_04885 [Opitutaceae bacterium]
MLRKLAILLFTLLAVGFLIRLIGAGHHWVTHQSSPEHNYRALTFWSAFYMAICAAFALGIASFTTPNETK